MKGLEGAVLKKAADRFRRAGAVSAQVLHYFSGTHIFSSIQ
jgi:hypothetical protein